MDVVPVGCGKVEQAAKLGREIESVFRSLKPSFFVYRFSPF
jgi:hypothetical protein